MTARTSAIRRTIAATARNATAARPREYSGRAPFSELWLQQLLSEAAAGILPHCLPLSPTLHTAPEEVPRVGE